MIICSCCCFRWCCINSCCTCSSGSCCFRCCSSRDRCCSSSCCSRSRCIMQARFQWWEIQWMENLKIFSFRLHSLVIELAIRSFMPITDQIHELVTSSDINCWFCKRRIMIRSILLLMLILWLYCLSWDLTFYHCDFLDACQISSGNVCHCRCFIDRLQNQQDHNYFMRWGENVLFSIGKINYKTIN